MFPSFGNAPRGHNVVASPSRLIVVAAAARTHVALQPVYISTSKSICTCMYLCRALLLMYASLFMSRCDITICMCMCMCVRAYSFTICA